jgi:hypothetical protein
MYSSWLIDMFACGGRLTSHLPHRRWIVREQTPELGCWGSQIRPEPATWWIGGTVEWYPHIHSHFTQHNTAQHNSSLLYTSTAQYIRWCCVFLFGCCCYSSPTRDILCLVSHEDVFVYLSMYLSIYIDICRSIYIYIYIYTSNMFIYAMMIPHPPTGLTPEFGLLLLSRDHPFMGGI